MATTETEVTIDAQGAAGAKAAAVVRSRKEETILDKGLGLLSSVRFGLVMLSLLLLCCFVGMIIMQQEVDGFTQYYQRLTPSQQFIYGKLDLFNIYHASYFTIFLAITGLNIILASIDRFPAAWQYVVKPKLKASPNFIRAQMFNKEASLRGKPAEVADKIKDSWRRRGLRPRISEDNGRITVFAQRFVWNRLGAYVVHVALLTIFTGGFLTNRYGIGGMMEIVPGKVTDTFQTVKASIDGPQVGTAKLPFKLECTDLQQTLIRPEGGLEANNTFDWLSYVTIKDEQKRVEVPALVHLNEPHDYRGYRFFQSQFQPRGNAREITISFIPVSGGAAQDVTVKRNSSTKVEGLGDVSYVEFYPDFTIEGGGPATVSADYNRPAAELKIVSPEGTARRAFAFGPELADTFFNSDDKMTEKLLVNGNKVLLKSFEKVASSHTLAVQYDPGRKPVYAGFILLMIALCGVFFFAHQRTWAVIEPDENGGSKVHVGGNTNRSKANFEDRFNLLAESAIHSEEATR